MNRVVLGVVNRVVLGANGGGNGISLTGVFVLVGVFVRDLISWMLGKTGQRDERPDIPSRSGLFNRLAFKSSFSFLSFSIFFSAGIVSSFLFFFFLLILHTTPGHHP